MEVVVDNKVLEFVADFKKPESTSEVRKQAMDALSGMDFPTIRVEEWKYTRVAKYVKRKYNQVQATANVEDYTIADLNAHQLVFVNGYYDESLSTIQADDAVSIQKIEELNEEYYSDIVDGTAENVFSLINKAYQTGGVFIQVKKNKKANHPIHLIHVLEGEEVIANARHFVHLESGSKAEVLATYHSNNSENSFTNIVLEGHIEENASLTINKMTCIRSEEHTSELQSRPHLV